MREPESSSRRPSNSVQRNRKSASNWPRFCVRWERTEEAQEQLKIYQQRLKEESDKSLAILKSTQAEEAVKAGDNRKAADLFREASAALPDNPALAYRLAIVLGELGDTAGERTALQKAIKADTEFAPAHYQLGYLETRDGNNAAAEQQFRLALKAAPNYTQALVALAATLGMESRFQEAQDAVATALRIEPDNQGRSRTQPEAG